MRRTLDQDGANEWQRKSIEFHQDFFFAGIVIRLESFNVVCVNEIGFVWCRKLRWCLYTSVCIELDFVPVALQNQQTFIINSNLTIRSLCRFFIFIFFFCYKINKICWIICLVIVNIFFFLDTLFYSSLFGW